jgi:hypothetical protein
MNPSELVEEENFEMMFVLVVRVRSVFGFEVFEWMLDRHFIIDW